MHSKNLFMYNIGHFTTTAYESHGNRMQEIYFFNFATCQLLRNVDALYATIPALSLHK